MEQYHFKIKGKSGKNSLYCYFSAKSEARADREIMNLLEDNNIKTGRGKDYALPARIECPDGELPEEGVFCEITENGELRPLEATTNSDTPDAPDTDTSIDTDSSNADTITDSDNTAVDPLPTYAYNVNGELMSDVEKNMTQSVSGKIFAVRFMANWQQPQCVTDVATWRLQEINAELMDPTGYMADIELALSDKEISSRLDKLEMRDVHCYARDIEKVFPENKRPGIQHVREFTKAWLDTDYIDRGLLVKEWQKGNWVSHINKQEISDKPELQKTSVTKADVAVSGEPATKTTYKTIDTRIGCALTKGEVTYPLTARVVEQGKAIVEADGEEFKRWSATYRITENIQFYDEKTHIEMIRQAPRDVVTGSPELLRVYVDNYLAAYGTLDPDQMVFMPKRAPVDHAENLERVRKAGKNLRDMAAGRFKYDEEKPQSEDVLADEPATAETVEPNTTEHHQDTQSPDSTLPVENDKTPREQFSEQLAADRGDFVPGISDPNAPKWVRDDYSASNEGEKTEVAADSAADTADYVDHVEEFSNQPEPVADQIEPETEPKVSNVVPAPKPEWPTYFEYGRYEGVPNSAYHAADGISSSMLKDARISLMYFYGRYVAGTIKRETSDAFTMGSLVHSLILEPAKFDEEYAVFPGIPAGAFTNTDSLKAFIREYNADKPKGEQLKLTGKKEDLQEAIRAVKPDAIFADEYEQQWIENIGNKTVLTGEQLRLAKAMQQAVLSDSVAGYYVNHPSRSVEVSYFGMDEDTEMDVRVRPDLEITIDNERVGIDLKTISMGRIRQDMLRARLHREIIDRDYHVSAAMYCDVANLDKFYWIFVNKDEGYHWVAVVEASREEIELGRLEYRKTMLALKKAYDSGVWPAPITEQYTDNLNDYDIRRLEMLSEQV
ncbi:TPA: exodeoxyribonuclease VIII [Salmonella enterica]|uniref:Exodeoxyribonuclease VIII n=1 Tax=Salmonella enterica TaxID=28901 RepID=A0A754B5G1_SALER|nr:PD-(D/E)XK nuclease-like domain-containing protein [Salmonella enterica]ECU9162019.1 exodeoxyribonuclease VIII [Salmonella enterica subsp. enterica serovar Newport str. CFSAN000599]EDU1196565.1 exodeoxyribonuclease VIII [Salmonella enterica subsp. enterica serovar Heidelberg str. CFSAN000576]HAF8579407.1 exodeoxyribonuclease VIII [Salmonella enterica]